MSGVTIRHNENLKFTEIKAEKNVRCHNTSQRKPEIHRNKGRKDCHTSEKATT